MAIYDLGIKKKQSWYILRYSDGQEDSVVEEMMAWAEDPTVDFDWTDAAKLAWKVVNSAAGRIKAVGDPQSAKFAGKGGAN